MRNAKVRLTNLAILDAAVHELPKQTSKPNFFKIIILERTRLWPTIEKAPTPGKDPSEMDTPRKNPNKKGHHHKVMPSLLYLFAIIVKHTLCHLVKIVSHRPTMLAHQPRPRPPSTLLCTRKDQD